MLNKAIKFASHNQEKGRFTLCAIITDKKGRILSTGFNSFTKSHPTMAYYAEKVGNKNRIYLHAEMQAILRLKYTDKPHAIYVARVNKDKKPVLAKPCDICMRAILDAGIREINFTGE